MTWLVSVRHRRRRSSSCGNRRIVANCLRARHVEGSTAPAKTRSAAPDQDRPRLQAPPHFDALLLKLAATRNRKATPKL